MAYANVSVYHSMAASGTRSQSEIRAIISIIIIILYDYYYCCDGIACQLMWMQTSMKMIELERIELNCIKGNGIVGDCSSRNIMDSKHHLHPPVVTEPIIYDSANATQPRTIIANFSLLNRRLS